MLELGLLGPLEVRWDGQVHEISAPRLRTVLGTLLLRAGQVVPVQHLVDSVWEGRPPADPANQIAACISQLRRRFRHIGCEREPLVTQSPGYRLRVEDVKLDAIVFGELREQARAHSDANEDHRALSRLKAALALWRGPVLSGLSPQAWQPELRRWEEEFIATHEASFDLQLRLGLYEDVITELSAFIERYPLLERPRAQLMLALSCQGRQADALQLYQETSLLLRDELGVAPGRELRAMHEQVLRGDGGTDSAAASRVPPSAPPAPASVVTERVGSPDEQVAEAPASRLKVPFQLPGDLADFVGRDSEILLMHETLTPITTTPPVVMVIGAGGTGKTALAVHAAHQLRSVFRDGQLYVNLRGMDAHPVPAEEALARFLRELGLSGASIPSTLDERSALFRSLLAHRRMLLLLDDVRDARQVMPLLPGTGTCGVLITSRLRITTVPRARVLELTEFSQTPAHTLLAGLVGLERIAAEPDVAAELVEYCGRLPLAVRIVGAKLASKPHWPLRKAAARLSDERRRLDELAHENLAVRSSLELSHQGLSPAARRLFRRLSLLATPEFSDWVCAPLLGEPLITAEDYLDELLDVGLVEIISPPGSPQPRYRLHDLVRLFAWERLTDAEPQAQQHTAVRRLAETTLALARAAHEMVCGGDFTVVHNGAPLSLAAADVVAELGGDPLGWYEIDRPIITALCRQLADQEQDELAWDLAATCRCLFSVRFHFDDWLATHEGVLDAVRQRGNRRGEAAILLGLGDLYLTKRQYERAIPLLETSQRLFSEVGDQHGHALALRKAACADRVQGRPQIALARWQECLAILRDAGDLEAQAQVLRWTAQTRLEEGLIDEASAALDEAAGLVERFNGRSAAQVRLSQAELHMARNDLAAAGKAYGSALEATTALGDLSGRCAALMGLGVVATGSGCGQEAEEYLGQALHLARDIHDPLLESDVLFALAAVRRSAGDLDGTIRLLEEGAQLCRRIGAPLRLERFVRASAAYSTEAAHNSTR
ncbi:BTAD domain-containing putative transcriptional regulator [Streptomyces lavendulocolor]|uniref:AfsR/SARP family transcriptional regulator n=1 Tax=Streptomyces lavendulocolor TaxID=67316 RepID=UPI003C305502